MENIEPSGARPAAIKLALVLLSFYYGVGFVLDVVNFQWSHYVFFGIWLIEDILCFLLCFCLFQGRNWARWFLVVLIFGGDCLFLPHFFQRYHTFPAYYLVWAWVSILADIVVLIALFRPTSNRWLREKRMLSHGRKP